MEKLALFFAAFLLLMANRIRSESQNPDAFSLSEFRSHISADPFHVLANWTSKTSACNWVGVSCGSRNGRVVGLNVSGMSLGGSIASNIANLTFLTSLDLSNNNFAGSIPAELYECRHLETLSLSYNNLSGSIPTTLGYFENLKDLDIGGNAFTGGIPWEIGNLTQVENINMGTNFLTGPIPSSIFNITTLRVMDFSNNSLSGSFQHSIYTNLPFLESLYLYTNQFSGPIPPFIWNCKSLQDLALGDNVFTGSLSPSVANLTSLKYLYLQSNGLTGMIPSSISNASEIMEIVVLNNRLSGYVPDSIGNLRFLRRLFIGGNNLTSSSTHELTFITSLTKCRELEHVEMSENQFNGFLPASVGNLSESLRVFNAFGSRITGSIPNEIGNMSSLQSINLDSNEFTGSIPSTIAKLSRLDRIYLEYNKLQGYIPAELCQLTNLGDLYLNENMLSGPIPDCLGNLKSLRNVFLQSNNLTSTIPSSLWSLTDLLGLNLSSNSLSGAVSPEIQNLRAITQLDLSWNRISGVIPSSIGSSKTLVYLSLAQNSFEGGIPESLGNMISLEYLDLSHNNITGSIPKALENLEFLKYLDLSFNKLEGEIPTGGCFSNFTAESYVQNYALCGATRLHVQTCRLIRKPSPSKSKELLLRYILPPIGCALLIAASVTAYLWGRRRRKYMKPQIQSQDQNDMSLPPQWLRFSYLDLFKATDSFSSNSLLGTGSFGSVFKAMFSDGLTVAVKVFHMQSEGVNKSFSAECIALASIRHRNIIKILSCVSTEAFKALVLEYMPNGSLESWLHSGSLFLDMVQRLNVAIDVASALDYLHHFHDPPIVHCDLKPSNILIDQDMRARLTDFGMAKIFHEHELLMQTKTLATVGYMAPEYGASGIVSTSGDVYSYGVVLLELFTRKRPTDDMFGEKSNLRDWVVKSMLANSVEEVVDDNLIGQEEEQMLSAKKECFTNILGVGVECLSGSPQQRISFSEILARLTKIRAALE